MKFSPLLCGAVLAIAGAFVAPATRANTPANLAAERDGSHDFDFDVGVWKTHIVRRLHPLSGSNEWIELNGTVTLRKVWGGRAQLEEIETDGPLGHWQGMSLFLYNPKAHQWSQTFIGSKGGAFAGGTIGSFRNGRGELFAPDTFDGRAILVRGAWSNITPKSHRYEESYSADGGKTWEIQFTADKTRLADAAPAPTVKADHDGSHDFDFDFGSWKTHSSRLQHPLTGAKDWVETDGLTQVTPVWSGKASLVEFKIDGPEGPDEALALRVYNPTTKQWSINFATLKGGMLSDVPGIGEAHNGRIDFYDQRRVNGKATLARLSIWSTGANVTQSEQAFSADGGKTWEVNATDRYTRADGVAAK